MLWAPIRPNILNMSTSDSECIVALYYIFWTLYIVLHILTLCNLAVVSLLQE